MPSTNLAQQLMNPAMTSYQAQFASQFASTQECSHFSLQVKQNSFQFRPWYNEPHHFSPMGHTIHPTTTDHLLPIVPFSVLVGQSMQQRNPPQPHPIQAQPGSYQQATKSCNMSEPIFYRGPEHDFGILSHDQTYVYGTVDISDEIIETPDKKSLNEKVEEMVEEAKSLCTDDIVNSAKSKENLLDKMQEVVDTHNLPKEVQQKLDARLDDVCDDLMMKKERESLLRSFQDRISSYKETEGWSAVLKRVMDADFDVYKNGKAWDQLLRERLNIKIKIKQRERQKIKFRRTSAFMEVFDKLMTMMSEAQTAQPCRHCDHSCNVVETFNIIEGCLKYMLRRDFDPQGALSKCAVDVVRLVEAFKKEQVFPESLSCLQAEASELSTPDLCLLNKFLQELSERYADWEVEFEDSKYKFECMTSIACEMMQLLTRTMRKTNDINYLLKAFLQYLGGDIEFKEIDLTGYTKIRNLRIHPLCSELMALGFSHIGDKSTTDSENLGYRVVLRCKQMGWFSEQGWEFIKFLKLIKETETVVITDSYIIMDRRPLKDKQKKKNLSRRIVGILLNWILPSKEEVRRLLQLLVAWSEPKEGRDLIFSKYPGLKQLQHERKTEEDQKRSILRQEMIRKAKSFDHILDLQKKREEDLTDLEKEELKADQEFRNRFLNLKEDWPVDVMNKLKDNYHCYLD